VSQRGTEESAQFHMSLEHLERSVVVVTGAARGLGAAICVLLAERGFRHIAATARSLEDAETVAREVGPACKAFALDVTSDASVAGEQTTRTQKHVYLCRVSQ
jgi:NAD(P)-dependent dehydrogenase (short-subunit alcohol dehydrogenase family)